jgi:hypothetical protein
VNTVAVRTGVLFQTRVMWRRGSCVWSLVVVLANGVGVARADPLPERPPVTSASTALLSRAIEREVSRLVWNDGDGLWRAQSSGQSPTPTHLKRCTSKKKGLLIGAGIGAVAGGVFAAYVEKGLGGVRPEVVLEFAAGGAAVGTLGGLAYCR